MDLSSYSTCLRSISDMLMVYIVFDKYTDIYIAIIWQKGSVESDMNIYNAKYLVIPFYIWGGGRFTRPKNTLEDRRGLNGKIWGVRPNFKHD